MYTEKQLSRLCTATAVMARLALASGLGLSIAETARAEDAAFLKAPIQYREVLEFDLSGNLIQEDYSVTDPGLIDTGNNARIELGPAGNPDGYHAEAYASYDPLTQTPTYWVSISDYPGTPGSNNNGRTTAEVVQTWHMQKQSDDATVTLHVTGGRLQLVDYMGLQPLVASVRLDWYVTTNSASISQGQNVAVLTGHGGTLGGSETFDYTSQGFTIGGYAEQTAYVGSLNVVGATLDIPAQDIEVDIRSIFPVGGFSDGEFFLEVHLAAETLALYLDGGAALAFLRDPTSGGDPLLGGNGLTFTGITVLTPSPVPEPSVWASLLAGCGLIGWITRRRVLLAAGPQSVGPLRAEEEKTA